jgi:hypothetical protein
MSFRQLSRIASLVFLAAAIGFLASASGCGRKPTINPQLPEIATPGAYFKAKVAPTMDTHGKIVLDTVLQKGDKIRFQTEDGKKWVVSHSKRDDGNFEYSTPEENSEEAK